MESVAAHGLCLAVLECERLACGVLVALRRATGSNMLHRLDVLSFLSLKVDKIGKIGSSVGADPRKCVNLRRHLKAEYKERGIRSRMRSLSGLEIAGSGLKFRD